MQTGQSQGVFEHITVKVILGAISVVLSVAAFFWIAGRLDWLAGWSYVGLLTFGQTASAIYVWRKDPELLRRRGKIGEGTKSWDKVWLGLFGLMYLAILVVAALDAGRHGWSTMPVWLCPVGASLYVLFAVVFVTWAMVANTYFEKTVRIQHDRGHQVVDSGPYRIVRHPGYVGVILGFLLSPPLLLGSWWAFVPALLAVAWLFVRTALEDSLLRKELPGYAGYARRVRYRLIRGVW